VPGSVAVEEGRGACPSPRRERRTVLPTVPPPSTIAVHEDARLKKRIFKCSVRNKISKLNFLVRDKISFVGAQAKVTPVVHCGRSCSSARYRYSLRVSRCPFLVLFRLLGSFHALALAFACACALDLALGLARAFCVCVYFQHTRCLLSGACFLSFSCSFPLVLSRCLWPALVWISSSDFRDGVRARA